MLMWFGLMMVFYGLALYSVASVVGVAPLVVTYTRMVDNNVNLVHFL